MVYPFVDTGTLLGLPSTGTPRKVRPGLFLPSLSCHAPACCPAACSTGSLAPFLSLLLHKRVVTARMSYLTYFPLLILESVFMKTESSLTKFTSSFLRMKNSTLDPNNYLSNNEIFTWNLAETSFKSFMVFITKNLCWYDHTTNSEEDYTLLVKTLVKCYQAHMGWTIHNINQWYSVCSLNPFEAEPHWEG